jgi:peptidoglycan/LPS O-acetylase OafA/YrhL
LRELDGFRAISVLLVVVHHVLGSQHARILSRFSGLASVVHYCGPLGVKIFFVISGFVIFRLLIAEELRFGSVSLKAFYYRRALRILPPFLLYLGTISLLLCLGWIHEYWRAILGSALFLSDVHVLPQSWFVGHTWSLAVEEQSYLIFPMAWALIPQRSRNLVFFGAFLFFAGWNLSMVYTGWDSLISSDIRAGFACISFGVLLACHEKRVRTVAKNVPALILALVALMLLLHPIGSRSWQSALYECLLVPPAIGIMLCSSLERGPWLRAFLCSKPVQAVGCTSYGVYLWQQPFTAPKVNFSGAGEIIPLLLPLLCLIVPLSYFLIEKPAMRYGRSLSRRIRGDSIQPEYRNIPSALAEQ